jgi:hypothetical protein
VLIVAMHAWTRDNTVADHTMHWSELPSDLLLLCLR